MDLLSDILGVLKLRGTIYFRTSFHEPWGVKVPSYENVIRFHFAHRGRFWLRVKNSDQSILVNQGDLVLIPHGSEHTILNPADAVIEELDQVTSEYLGQGVLVYGDKNIASDCQLICGHWSFEKDASHPLITLLPPCLHIESSNNNSRWLESTLSLIGAETETDQPGNQLIALKLSETIFTQSIRHFLSSTQIDITVLNGLRDPRIYKVLQALHQRPSYNWTLEKMAEIACVSRTSFVNHFNALMGTTPLRYLTQWRLQIGRQLLTDSDTPIINVAEKCGYQSEAAFSRAFKSQFETGPAQYRKTNRSLVMTH